VDNNLADVSRNTLHGPPFFAVSIVVTSPLASPFVSRLEEWRCSRHRMRIVRRRSGATNNLQRYNRADVAVEIDALPAAVQTKEVKTRGKGVGVSDSTFVSARRLPSFG
jgi:hypothetical protein